ncbi:hypothetical protein Drorol1_Dr00026851, partial [Drosera rotundifolia]
MDLNLVVQVRSCKCATLGEMVEHAARIEDAMIIARGFSQKRSGNEPAQNKTQFRNNQQKKKRIEPSQMGGLGGSSFHCCCRPPRSQPCAATALYAHAVVIPVRGEHDEQEAIRRGLLAPTNSTK